MLKNYFKVTLRNLAKNLSHTAINVVGLTLGISGAILIFLVVTDSLKYDTHHTKKDRLYRVVTQSKESTGTSETTGVPVPLTEAVINYFPEVERGSFVSFDNGGLVSIERNGKTEYFPESSGIVFLDSNFYKMFDRPVLVGEADNAFKEPKTVFLSRRFAVKYFNSIDVVGKMVKLNNQHDLKVVGVMEDFGESTQFPFDFMVSYETVRAEKADNNRNGWGSIWSDEQCYVLLHADAKAASVNEKFPAFVDKNYPQEGNFPTNSTNRFHWLQPINELHFDTRFSNYLYRTTSKMQLASMSIVGLLLIVTAAINFINLTTALAINRSKEVGVRKVMGSNRRQLISQFLGETFMITAISVVVSVALADVLLRFALNPFMEMNLKLSLLDNGPLALFLVAILFGVSLLSGLYPSLVISRFNPVNALKNNISGKTLGGIGMRKALVVGQFFITQFLVICTIVVMWQTQFMRKFDMGFAKEAIGLVNLPVRDKSKMQVLATDLQAHAGIKRVSSSANAPASGSSFGTSINFKGESEEYSVEMKLIDQEFINLYKIKLVAGKNIIEEDTARRILVNATLARHVGAEAQALLGRVVNLNGRDVVIDGVIEDFHAHSLSQEIEPMILYYDTRYFNTMSFQTTLADWADVKPFVEAKWKAVYPEYSMNLRFMDEDIAGFYDGADRSSTLALTFAGVAIFIGCIGLYGLVMFMSKVKTKEIGIRKTLGASVASIVNMFSVEFIKLVALAFLFASPLAWLLMSKWLSNYSYHIDLNWQVFTLGLTLTIVIALATVAHRSVKSALANPVDSLKAE